MKIDFATNIRSGHEPDNVRIYTFTHKKTDV
jgi:hypothetical protein